MSGLKRGPVTTHRRFSKRSRKDSSDDLSVEEILPDDMAYDADVEVVYPDQYEEAGSELEESVTSPGTEPGSVTPRRKLRDLDEELAARMRWLGHNRFMSSSSIGSGSDRGRKRQSNEMEEDIEEKVKGKDMELEVVEVVEGLQEPPPLKRRRGQIRRSTLSQRLSDGNPETISHDFPWRESTSRGQRSTSGSSGGNRGQGAGDDSAMEVS